MTLNQQFIDLGNATRELIGLLNEADERFLGDVYAASIAQNRGSRTGGGDTGARMLWWHGYFFGSEAQ